MQFSSMRTSERVVTIMRIPLIEENRRLWSNLRNYLYPMDKPEVLNELALSIQAGDTVRACLIDHYLSTEFGD